MSAEAMLQEAREALRQGQHSRARDLLTRLLRADQSNPAYWLWMSAAVESTREQIFCLRAALKVDPANSAARQGLIMLGALPAAPESVPSPLVRRRWKVEPIGDTPTPSSSAGGLRPALRLPFYLVLTLLVGGLILLGLVDLGDESAVALPPVGTPGLLPTYTATNTSIPLARTYTAEPVHSNAGPTPLWMRLEATYTPTPLYVNTPHAISEAYRAGLRAFQRGDWQSALDFFQQASLVEASSADIYLYLGEVQRMLGDYSAALQAFEQAISTDPLFAPGFLGRARILLATSKRSRDQDESIQQDLDRALELDPGFGEAYLERAALGLMMGNLESARQDLKHASGLLPDSPLVYLYRAQLALQEGEIESALSLARQAFELDRTLLPAYLVLGQACLLNGEFEAAIETLEIYLEFEVEDAVGWLALGQAYAGLSEPSQAYFNLLRAASGRDFAQAILSFDRALALDDSLSYAFLYRGISLLALGEGQKAVNDLLASRAAAGELSDQELFAIDLGLGRALLAADRLQDAFAQINSLEARAPDDESLAAVLYWRARALEAADEGRAADRDWSALLEMPVDVVPSDWRLEARSRLSTPTATQGTAYPSAAATPQPTPARTATPISAVRAAPTQH